ncbi:uncharacterized protein PV09_05689 [Verruconis gallopava]|uniref:Enoyl reductase (ER) domain-containing protein n=1 Tax=Verruconis gallopava TaxID=253628 RepID=A0A0D1XL20_9PEZI|nr:uncharacterized protein PV09_05689 [Verruconis gallopava]KIW03036.1 hypothetical protein PV09_05689 [Verruconis gallopava]
MTPSTSQMKHAIITAWEEPPKFVDTAAPQLDPVDDKVLIRVEAAAAHQLVRLRASGKHYSVKTLPHVPGVDGVGTTPDGQNVYFFTFAPAPGSFAEFVRVPKGNVTPLPDGLDKIQVAALVNPVMSSWMALRRRTFCRPPNFTVLILGATSTSGRLAISVARALGAGRVIGCARNEESLARLGLDQAIRLREPVTETDFSDLQDVDVVLDYVYGQAAAHLLSTIKCTRRVQFIQIGSLSGPTIDLPAHTIRSKNISLIGSGIGSWADEELREELPDLLQAMTKFETVTLNVVPLSEIERHWSEGKDRTVFTM